MGVKSPPQPSCVPVSLSRIILWQRPFRARVGFQQRGYCDRRRARAISDLRVRRRSRGARRRRRTRPRSGPPNHARREQANEQHDYEQRRQRPDRGAEPDYRKYQCAGLCHDSLILHLLAPIALLAIDRLQSHSAHLPSGFPECSCLLSAPSRSTDASSKR